MTLRSSRKTLIEDASQHGSVPTRSPHRKLVNEAAAYLGLSASTLNKTRLTGTGPRFLKLGRRVLYDPRHLEAWAGERTRNNTSQQP